MSQSIRDPFYSVKDKVHSAIQSVRSEFQQWETLDMNSADYPNLTKRIRSGIAGIKTDLNDLAQTIAIVVENRGRFASIDDRELESRKEFVTQTKGIIAAYESQLKKAKQKQDAETRRAVTAQPKPGALKGSASASRFNSAMAAEENREKEDLVTNARAQHQQVEEKQDIILEDMSAALSRLSNLNEDIHTKLEVHGRMLDDLDSDLNEAQDNMTMVLKKIDKLLKTSDKGRLCCIVLLVFVAITLLIAIVYG